MRCRSFAMLPFDRALSTFPELADLDCCKAPSRGHILNPLVDGSYCRSTVVRLFRGPSPWEHMMPLSLQDVF